MTAKHNYGGGDLNKYKLNFGFFKQFFFLQK